MMPHPMTIPGIAGLALAGASLGLYLGHSAVGEINPAYFGTPERSAFHADLSPYRAPGGQQAQARELLLAETGEGLGNGCVGCRDYPEEYHPRPDPAVDRDLYDWSATTETRTEIEVAYQADPVLQDAADLERENIARYVSYPITEEEAEAQSSVAEAEPEAAEMPAI